MATLMTAVITKKATVAAMASSTVSPATFCRCSSASVSARLSGLLKAAIVRGTLTTEIRREAMSSQKDISTCLGRTGAAGASGV